MGNIFKEYGDVDREHTNFLGIHERARVEKALLYRYDSWIDFSNGKKYNNAKLPIWFENDTHWEKEKI